MKIKKHYFGKRRGVSLVGRDVSGNWAVPRVLRKYFRNQQIRVIKDIGLKLAMNGTVGAPGKIKVAGVSGMNGFASGALGKIDPVLFRNWLCGDADIAVGSEPQYDFEATPEYLKNINALAGKLGSRVFTTSDSDFNADGERKTLVEVEKLLEERKENKRRLRSGGF